MREKALKIKGLIVGRRSEITPDDLDHQAIKGNRLMVQIIGFAPLLQKSGFHFFARRFRTPKRQGLMPSFDERG